jgi:biopolymer transport protein ExbB
MNEVLIQAKAVWDAGGWAMYGLALNSLILFALGINVWLRLWGKGYRSVRETTWRRWIGHAGDRKGVIGRLMDHTMDATTLSAMRDRFNEVRASELAPFARELRFMKICVSTAPLLGLLGTVTGMLVTFQALADGSGGQKTMDLVAKGISEALITTETGLVIALPGLFFQYHLRRERDKYGAFLAKLETACLQFLHRMNKRSVQEQSVPA